MGAWPRICGFSFSSFGLLRINRQAPFLLSGSVARALYRVMTRPPRNPRRAYDHQSNEIRPMSLGKMREHGVRSVLAICQESSCGHSGSLIVDHLPDGVPVPDVSLRLRCSACGSRNVKTQPDWKQSEWHRKHVPYGLRQFSRAAFSEGRPSRERAFD